MQNLFKSLCFEGQSSAESGRRGTLADLGRTFGGVRSKKLTSAASVAGPPPIEPDFMSKIRKRRETSADITVLRKGSGTVTDLKSDITRYVSEYITILTFTTVCP